MTLLIIRLAGDDDDSNVVCVCVCVWDLVIIMKTDDMDLWVRVPTQQTKPMTQ